MFPVPENVCRVIEERFGRKRVLVVGDLMLDDYLWGSVRRISPEAPVPVVALNRRSAAPGGSGNVVANLIGLGLEVVAAGVVGDDSNGRRLCSLLTESGVSTSGIVTLSGRPTTTKTRVVCGHQQMLRLDEEDTRPPSEDALARLAVVLMEQLAGPVPVAAVILSDYAKGTLTPEICGLVIDEARSRGIPTLVDPKGGCFSKYAGATILTPNFQEFAGVVEIALDSEAALREAGQRLREGLRIEFLTVTCGDQGITYFTKDAMIHHPAVAREVYDVSGAGDTVIATLAASLVAGLDLGAAVPLANLAAGVVVGKVGTTPISLHELLEAVRNVVFARQPSKVCDAETLHHRLRQWRSRGERVVFTNGCFDLLHVGHVTLLNESRQKGDRLVVGLNTDRSVRSLKGPTRPVVGQEDRAQVLAGLASVDAVVLFDEETPLELIKAIHPDVLVKGGDYVESEIVGADVVRSYGGSVAIIPLVEGRSTTSILAASQSRQ